MTKQKPAKRDKSPYISILTDQDGFILVMAILLLSILVIVGLSTTTNTITELKISRNDTIHHTTFYAADGGTEVGVVLVEDSISGGGFIANTGIDNTVTPALDATQNLFGTNVVITNLTFDANTSSSQPSEVNRDLYFPNDYGSATDPHTNITIGGVTTIAKGAGLQMISGYEGMGKSAAKGGTYQLYDIYSQHIGRSNSQSTVLLQWRHVSN